MIIIRSVVIIRSHRMVIIVSRRVIIPRRPRNICIRIRTEMIRIRSVRIRIIMVMNAVVMPTVVNHRTVPRIIKRMPIFRRYGSRYNGSPRRNGKQAVKIDRRSYSRTVKPLDSDLVRVINLVFDFINAAVVVLVFVVVIVRRTALSVKRVDTQKQSR